jgi:O-antigen/teichoic acid export membrane protein
MSLRHNLLLGLSNSVWSALVGLAAIPFYLKYLGLEAYGLIGFFATTQAVLSLLDIGMAPTINREVARCVASGNEREAGKLLHTLAVIYWCVAIAIALMVLILAPWIARSWLQSKHLPSESITSAVILMGVVVACRWPIGLYQGALIGAQRLAISSGINIVMVSIGNLGCVVVLAFVSPTIEAFFIWQACVGLAHAIVIRMAAWTVIDRGRARFDINQLTRVWRFTAGAGIVSTLGVVFTQFDKVVLSKLLGLEEFAHYMLATIVVSGLYVVVSPAYSILYPRFAALLATGNSKDLITLYKLASRALAIVLFPAALALIIFSEDLIRVWTGNSDIASSVSPVVGILAAGSALHGVMFVPHALQMASGVTRLPILINSILLIFLLPLLMFFVVRFGAVGGAITWLILHVSYVFLGAFLTNKYLLKGVGMRWVVVDIGLPLGLTLLAGGVNFYMFRNNIYTDVARVLIGGGLILFVGVGSVFLSPGLIALLKSHFNSNPHISSECK